MRLPLYAWKNTLAKFGFRRLTRKESQRRRRQRPLQVEALERRELLAADLDITAFAANGNQLLVSYDVSEETAGPFAISVYRSSDGGATLGAQVATLDVSEANQRTVGGHQAALTANFTDAQEDYELFAVIDSGNAVAEASETNNQRLFGGGVFQAVDGTIHVQGSSAADDIEAEQPGQFNVKFNGTTYQYTASTVTALHVRTHGGDDKLVAGTGVQKTIWGFGGAGNDQLTGGADNTYLHGAAGDDMLKGRAGSDVLIGDEGDDALYGDAGNDLLDGGAGNDYLEGNEHDDVLIGGTGHDTLKGGYGQDTLTGGEGNDLLDGNQDADTLYGGAGNDTLLGGYGTDVIYGEAGNDYLEGNQDADVLDGGDGNDLLDGGAGNDTLRGGYGNDNLLGGSESDTLYGDDGADTLNGHTGNDQLYGGRGDDVLTGGGQAGDVVQGQEGNDIENGVNDGQPSDGANGPRTSGIASVVVQEDAAPMVIDLWSAFDDHEDADSALTYTIVGNTNPLLFSSTTIQAASGTLTLAYAAHAYGAATLTVRATDPSGRFVETAFGVTITAVNDAPSGALADVAVDEDGPDQAIDLWAAFDDVDHADEELTFELVGNTHPALFSSAVILAASGTLALVFAEHQHGASTLTVRATDPLGAAVERSFAVHVAAVNDPPTGTIADVMVAENAPAHPIDLWAAFADVDHDDAELIFTVVENSHPALFAGTTIAADGTLTLAFAPQQSGVATLTVRATDPAGGQAEASFDVHVAPVNDAPVAAGFAPLTVFEDASTLVVTLSDHFSDVEDGGANLIYEVVGNTAPGLVLTDVLLPDDESPAGAQPQLLIGLAPNTAGTAQLVIRATDRDGARVESTLQVVVRAVDDAPILGALDDGPDPAITGADLTLAVDAVWDDSPTMKVDFYRDADGNGLLNTSVDPLLGFDASPSGGWSVTVSTTGFGIGGHRYFAVATDSEGQTSQVVTSTGSVGIVGVLDDAHPGYHETGAGWSAGALPGSYDGAHRQAAAGSGANTATWSFTGLLADAPHRLYATWGADGANATNATYTVSDASGVRGTFTVDQTQAPASFFDGVRWWQQLIELPAVDGQLTIALTDDANGVVIADAIRVLDPPPTIAYLSGDRAQLSAGTDLRLTAYEVADADGSVVSVEFFLDDGDGVFNSALDPSIGSDTDGSDDFSVVYGTSSLANGTHRFFAVAEDNSGEFSSPKSFDLVVTAGATSGLVVHYKLDEGSGAVAGDSATADGTQNGSTNAPWAAGYSGAAQSFNGVSQSINITGYKGILGTASRTVAAWINTTEGGAVTHWGQAATGTRWTLRVGDAAGGGNGALRLETGSGQMVGTTDLRDGQWHHIAVVYDSADPANVSSIKLYIDGQLETINGSASQSGSFNTTAGLDVRIGHSHTGKRFKGLIDEYRIYNRALTQAEVQSLSPSLPNTAPTVADAELGIFGDGVIGQTLGTVLASDVDAGDTLTYEIVDGNDDGVFAIDVATGTITQANIPDFAAQTDNQYVLTIKVTDDGTPNLYRLATVTVSPLTESSGLKVHLTFDDADSDANGTTTDSATDDGAQHGLLRGGVTFADDDFGQWSASFNGVSQDIELTGYKGITGASARTVAAWVKTTRNGAITQWGQLATGKQWTVRIGAAQSDGTTDGRLRVETGGGLVVGSTDLRDNQWHHVAIVLGNDGSPNTTDVKLYVDGIEQTYTQVVAQAIDAGADRDVRIGHSHFGARFGGLLDDYRLYDRALSQGEVIRLVQLGGLGSGITTTVMSTTAGQAAVGTLSPSSPDPSAQFTFDIVAGDPDGLFAIDAAGQITITNTGAFDYGSAYQITVQVTEVGVASGLTVINILPGELVDGLVGLWQFNEGIGGSTADLAAGNSGSLQGTFQWRDSAVGSSAVEFNGINTAVTIDGYQGINGSNPRTVSAWIKTNGTGSLVSWGAPGAGQSFNLRINDGADGTKADTLRLDVGGGFITGSTGIRDNHWHQVAVVFSGDDVTDAKLYVDGVEEVISASQAQLVSTAFGSSVTFGSDAAGRRYAGLLDEVRIYDRALSDTEIATVASVPNSVPVLAGVSATTVITAGETVRMDVDVLDLGLKNITQIRAYLDLDGDGLPGGAEPVQTVAAQSNPVLLTLAAASLAPGSYTLVVEGLSDGGEILSTLSRSVLVVADPTYDPTAGIDIVSVTPNTPVTFDLLGQHKKTYPGQAAAIGNLGDPDHGTAVLNPDGSVTFTPDAGVGASGAVRAFVSYDIEDAQGNVIATSSALLIIGAVATRADFTATAQATANAQGNHTYTVTVTPGSSVNMGAGASLVIDKGDGSQPLTTGLTANGNGTYSATYSIDDPTAVKPVRVFAYDPAAAGGAVYQATVALAESPVPDLAVDVYSASEANVRWVNKAAGHSGSRVLVSYDGGSNFAQVATTGANTSSFLLTGLTPGASFIVKVEPIYAAGAFLQTASIAQQTVQLPTADPIDDAVRWWRVAITGGELTKGEAGFTKGENWLRIKPGIETFTASGVTYAKVAAASGEAAVRIALAGAANIINFNGTDNFTYQFPADDNFIVYEAGDASAVAGFVGHNKINGVEGYLIVLEDSTKIDGYLDQDYDDWYWTASAEDLPEVSISIDPASIDEYGNTTSTTITVSRTGATDRELKVPVQIVNKPSDAQLGVDFSLAGATFVNNITTIAIGIGQAAATFTLSAIDDAVFEGIEQFGFQINELADFVIAVKRALGALVDDEPPPQPATVDLDIDSDNNDGLKSDWVRTQHEDDIEDADGQTGKILPLTAGDSDNDGIKDWQDGYNRDGIANNADDENAELFFTPMVLEIPSTVDIATATFQFIYSDSDPQQANGDSAATGHLRIWKKDGSDARAVADYIASGQIVTAAQLGVTAANRRIVLYVEQVAKVDDHSNRISVNRGTGADVGSFAVVDYDTIRVGCNSSAGDVQVAISATNAYAAEANGDIGQFTISRGEGNTSGDLQVYYKITVGSAAPDRAVDPGVDSVSADYNESLAQKSQSDGSSIGSIIIAAGQSSVVLTVTPKDDEFVEWDEKVTVTLIGQSGYTTSDASSSTGSSSTGSSSSGSSSSGGTSACGCSETEGPSTSSATVTILDNDEIGGLLNRNIDTESTGLTKEMIFNGTVAVDVQGGQATLVLPLIARGLSPTYLGDDNLLPIISVEMKLPSTSTPDQLKATLTFGGIASEEVEFANLSQVSGTTDRLRFVLLGDATIAQQLRTGHYDYDVTFTATTGSDALTRTIRGSTELFNRVDDEIGDIEFGKKWWLPGLDRIVVDDGNSARLADQGLAAIGGAAVMRGDGSSAFYTTGAITSEHEYKTIATSDTPLVSKSGAWSDIAAGGYRYLSGSGEFNWHFGTDDGVTPPLEEGRLYQVFVTWTPGADRTTDAQYTVSNARQVGTRGLLEANAVPVDQRFTPGEITYDGDVWRSLGFYVLNEGETEITVTLESGTNGFTIADRAMIVEGWVFDTPDGSFNALVYGDIETTTENGHELATVGGYHAAFPSGLKPGEGDFTLVAKHGSHRQFDYQGLLQHHVDRNHNVTKYEYTDADEDDVEDELSKITDIFGIETEYVYASGVLDKVVEFANHTARETDFTITSGYITSITKPDPGHDQAQPVLNFTHGGPGGQLSLVTNGRGDATIIDYDETHQRVTSVSNADVSNGNGAPWEIAALLTDGLNDNEVRIAGAGEIGSASSSGGSGEQAKATYTDPRQNEWIYQVDAYGLILAMANPAHSGGGEDVWTYERNAQGLLTKRIEPAGGGGASTSPLEELTTEYFYDGALTHEATPTKGNLTKVVYAQAAETPQGGTSNISETWEYDEKFNVVTSHTDPRGFVTLSTLDDYGNVEELTQPEDVVTTFEYTPVPSGSGGLPGGLVKKVTDPRGVVTETTYFSSGVHNGLVDKIEHAKSAPGGIQEAASTETFTYDPRRNVASHTQQMDSGGNRVANYTYDTLGRLVKVELPSASHVGASGGSESGQPTTTYEYDGEGLLIKQTDALGRVTEFKYDGMFRLTVTTLPSADHFGGSGEGTITNDYDANGNLISVKDQLDRTISYEYDARNLRTKETRPSTSDHGASEWVFTYDALGNLATAQDPLGSQRTTKYEYDSLHRLTKETRPAPGAHPQDGSAHGAPELEYEYDDTGNRTKVIDALDRETVFVYDDLGRVTSIQQPLSATTHFEYDAAGHRTVVKDAANGDEDGRYEYDALGRVVKVTRPATSQHASPVTQYAYNDAGERSSVIETTPAGQRTTTYEYDALGRNTVIQAPPSVHTNPVTGQTFTDSGRTDLEYDKVGNLRRTEDAGGKFSASYYDALNREVAIVQSHPQQSGINLGQSASSLASAGYSVTVVSYDIANQMRQKTVYVDGGTRVSDYEYDNQGRRTRTLEPSVSGQRSETVYHYDKVGNVTSEDHRISASKVLTTSYKYDNLNRRILQEEPGASGGATTKTWFFYDVASRHEKTIDAKERQWDYGYDDLDRQTSTLFPQLTGESDRASTTTSYNLVGAVSGFTDRLGRSTTYFLDTLYRTVSTVMPATPHYDSGSGTIVTSSATLGTTYDILGRATHTTDELGRSTQHVYDNNDRLVQMILPSVGGSAPAWSYGYDIYGNLVRTVDPEGNVEQTRYDNQHRANTQIAPQSNPGSLSPTIIDDGQSGFAFAGGGSWTQVTAAGGHGADYHTIAAGTGTNTATWSFTGLDANRQYEVFVTWKELAGAATDAKFTVLDGVASEGTFTIDQTVAPEADETDGGSSWQSLGLFVISSTSIDVVLSDLAASGLVVADAVRIVERPPTVISQFNQAGEVTSHTDSLGRTTQRFYDGKGRLTKVILPDPDGGGSQTAPETRYEYDLYDRLTKETRILAGGTNLVKEYEYDDLHRKILERDGNGDETTFTYDAVGNLLTLTDPAANVTSYEYDEWDRLVEETITVNSTAQTRSYEYDRENNLTAFVDRNGRRVEYDYDAENRRVEERWYNASLTLVNTIETVYDERDRVHSVEDDFSKYTYTYDDLDRVVSVDNTGTPGVAAVVLASEYDEDNRLTELAATIGGTADFVNSYVYNGRDYLTSLTQSGQGGGNAVAYKRVEPSFDPSDQLDQILRYASAGTGDLVASSSFTYDNAGRLISITHSQGANILGEFRWQYDATNRVSAFSSKRDGTAFYTYDDRDQLTGEFYVDQYFDAAGAFHTIGSGGYGSFQPNLTYQYDNNGNRLRRAEVSLPDRYNPSHVNFASTTQFKPIGDASDSETFVETGVTVTSTDDFDTPTGTHNRIESDGTYDYLFDDHGNEIRQTHIANDTVQVYGYDMRNRLVSVTFYASTSDANAETGATKSIEYIYDMFNRRIGKIVDANGDGTVDSRERYVWHTGHDGKGNVVLDFVDDDLDGTAEASELSARYLWGQTVDQLFAHEEVAGDTLWALTDNLSTIRDLVVYDDGTNTTSVNEHYTYEAFGEVTSGDTSVTRYTYTAQELDRDTGLMYYDGRWLRPSTGRFTTPDPIEDDAENTYRAMANNPTNNTDPSGLRIPEGEWDGMPTNSNWLPGKSGRVVTADGVAVAKVPFRNGYVDFSQWSIADVPNVAITGDDYNDQKAADNAYRQKIDDPDWKRPPNYTWHHEGTSFKMSGKAASSTMQLVPSDLNLSVPHIGAASFARNPARKIAYEARVADIGAAYRHASSSVVVRSLATVGYVDDVMHYGGAIFRLTPDPATGGSYVAGRPDAVYKKVDYIFNDEKGSYKVYSMARWWGLQRRYIQDYEYRGTEQGLREALGKGPMEGVSIDDLSQLDPAIQQMVEDNAWNHPYTLSAEQYRAHCELCNDNMGILRHQISFMSFDDTGWYKVSPEEYRSEKIARGLQVQRYGAGHDGVIRQWSTDTWLDDFISIFTSKW